jgi:hypothetical protein
MLAQVWPTPAEILLTPPSALPPLQVEPFQAPLAQTETGAVREVCVPSPNSPSML